MKIFGLANFQTFFKKTCTNNPTSEIQIAPFLIFHVIKNVDWNRTVRMKIKGNFPNSTYTRMIIILGSAKSSCKEVKVKVTKMLANQVQELGILFIQHLIL